MWTYVSNPDGPGLGIWESACGDLYRGQCIPMKTKIGAKGYGVMYLKRVLGIDVAATDNDFQIYRGQFGNDKRNGHGTFEWEGYVYLGQFVKDKFKGFAQLTFPNGDIYYGRFAIYVNPHGRGIMYNKKDNSYTIAQWNQGYIVAGSDSKTDIFSNYAHLAFYNRVMEHVTKAKEAAEKATETDVQAQEAKKDAISRIVDTSQQDVQKDKEFDDAMNFLDDSDDLLDASEPSDVVIVKNITHALQSTKKEFSDKAKSVTAASIKSEDTGTDTFHNASSGVSEKSQSKSNSISNGYNTSRVSRRLSREVQAKYKRRRRNQKKVQETKEKHSSANTPRKMEITTQTKTTEPSAFNSQNEIRSETQRTKRLYSDDDDSTATNKAPRLDMDTSAQMERIAALEKEVEELRNENLSFHEKAVQLSESNNELKSSLAVAKSGLERAQKDTDLMKEEMQNLKKEQNELRAKMTSVLMRIQDVELSV
eukprot:m.19812 g.19812  ORF g.19812 m.19812 type:complete len:479 (-) comp6681_c0_seq1:81-1517(-)